MHWKAQTNVREYPVDKSVEENRERQNSHKKQEESDL